MKRSGQVFLPARVCHLVRLEWRQQLGWWEPQRRRVKGWQKSLCLVDYHAFCPEKPQGWWWQGWYSLPSSWHNCAQWLHQAQCSQAACGKHASGRSIVWSSNYLAEEAKLSCCDHILDAWNFIKHPAHFLISYLVVLDISNREVKYSANATVKECLKLMEEGFA